MIYWKKLFIEIALGLRSIAWGTVLGLMFTSTALAYERVAVIDSGWNNPSNACTGASYDFVHDVKGIGPDDVGHGTDIVNVIKLYPKSWQSYCIMSFKVFSVDGGTTDLIVRAVYKAIEAHATVINMSFNGEDFSSKEYKAIKFALSLGIKIFVASGNHSIDLDKSCNNYPACYKLPGLIVVGTFEHKTIANYGKIVSQKELFCYKDFCGTSASTAIATGKWLRNN